MIVDSYYPIPDGLNAELLFSCEISRRGKVIIPVVFSCGEDSVALIDKIDSPKYNPEHGSYGLPFNVVFRTGQNSSTAEDFALLKAADTFWGGRKLPLDRANDVEPLGIYKREENRDQETLFLPYAVHIDLKPGDPQLAMSSKFRKLDIGKILWTSTEEAKELLEKEHKRLGRGSSAAELRIVNEYIGCMTDPVKVTEAVLAQGLPS